MHISIENLRVVLAVAHARSFSAAALERHIAQSSLSRTVAQVEHQCGVRLFDRTTRQVALTVDGEEFVRTATRIVEGYDEGLAHFAGYLDGSRGVLRIAALPSVAAMLLPAIVSRHRVARPQVRVEVEDVLAAQVAQSVRSGRVDLALTVRDAITDSLQFSRLASDDFFCMVSPAHPYAARDSVAWDELAGESFIAFDEASSVRSLVDAVMLSRSIEPAQQVTARNIASVAGLCSAGLGVSAVPGLVVPLMGFAELRAVPLADPVVSREIGVLTDVRRATTPAVEGLLEVVGALAGEQVPLPGGVRWG